VADVVITEFIKGLESWGRNNHIDYPWRKEKRVFLRCLTELLLRRTTAEAVANRWDTVKQMSDARKVLRMTDKKLTGFLEPFGLINTRLSEVRELARTHLSRPLTKMSFDELIGLRGFGEYTAGAVVTFINGGRQVIVDSNYSRVFSRLAGIKYGPKSKDLLQLLDIKMPSPSADFRLLNEYILDFSKLVCRPSYPKCSSCFANRRCSYGLTNSTVKAKEDKS